MRVTNASPTRTRSVGAAPRQPRRPGTPPPSIGDPRGRQAMMTVFAMMVLALFAFRLIEIQAIDADNLAEHALAQRLTTSEISVPRADIVDRDGVVLATSVDRYHVWVNQQKVADWKRTQGGQAIVAGPSDAASILAPILGLDEASLEASLTGGSSFTYIAKDITPETWTLIRAEGIVGIEGEPTSQRIYPNGDVAGNVIGFVGGMSDRNGIWGIAGLEHAYEDQLLGTPGSLTYEKGGGNVVIPTGVRQESPAIPGQTLITTIDRDMQWQVQERLEQGVRETGAEWGSVIIMDVKTGEVYVLADSKTVDPNHPGQSGAEDRGSRAVSAVFEPGSTGKVITMAAVLEEGLATPTDRFVAPDQYTTSNGQTFHDSHEHARLNLTLTGILAKSSNTGTVQVGERLTIDQRYSYLEAFGFGESTGVGLPGESAGILHDMKNWDGRTRYTVLFGQGVSVTAMQTAQVYATIANGGMLISPTVVSGLRSQDGTVTTVSRAEPQRVVSEETAEELMLMLESVVSDGTGEAAKVPGYRIAGKTGTAQAADENGGMTDIVASFIGIAPADDPRIVVSVILYNPTKKIYGGSAAGPIFADVTSDALRSLGVPPSDSTVTHYPLTWG